MKSRFLKSTFLTLIALFSAVTNITPPLAAQTQQATGATPAILSAPSASATAIATGWDHTCALTTTGGVKCWGDNTFGQLGDGGGGTDCGSGYICRLTPVDVVGLTSGVTAIAAGSDHTCALTTTGGVKCWGYNWLGQLGDGTRTQRNMPVDVVGLTSGVIVIAAGSDHTCALTTTGGVKCWGDNDYGQLGDGRGGYGQYSLTPVNVSGLSSGVIAVAANSSYHTCALITTGGVKCWGENYYGELGDNWNCGTGYCITPVNVVGLTTGVTTIAAGGASACALTSSGGVKCWGDNTHGQLGDGGGGTACDGGSLCRPTPVDVVGLVSSVTAIATGTHTCVLTTSGGVKCWGYNSNGQLGDGGGGTACGTGSLCRLTPVDVVGLASGVTAIATGAHTCALTTSGGVKCWGYNARGQLGDGTTTDRYTPVDVVGFGGGTTFSVSGRVTNSSSNPISGVTVSDGVADTATTDSNGNYMMNGLAAGTYTLSATTAGHKFWPNAQPIVLSGNATQNFSEWIHGISDVPLYLQGDPWTPSTLPWHPSWYNQTLLGNQSGDTYDTIGRYGCGLVSYAMILSYYGQFYSPPFQSDPGDLNTHMQALDPGSFQKYAWSKGVNVFQSSTGPANDFTGLDHQLSVSGNLAMLQLDVDGSPSGVHFVVATGETTINGQVTYTIDDPVYGQVTLLGQYGKNDFKAAYYYMLGPTTFNRSYLEISAHSPIQLLVTDAQGHRVGYDPRTGLSYNEIPNAGYVAGAIAGPDGNTLPEFKYVLIPQPTSGSYTVQSIGTGSGPYTLDAIQTDASGNTIVSHQSGTAQLNSVNSYVVSTGNPLFLPIIRR